MIVFPVSGDCGSIIGDIPEAKPVSETHIGMWHDSLFV
jgi:hypothetical protein